MPETLVSASVQTHAGYNPDLIQRAQIGGIWLADWPTASPITSLIDSTAAGKIKIPDTYESVGQLSEDGVEVEFDLSMIEIRGWGSTTVLRRDFESYDQSITFSMLEDKRIAYDAAMSADTKAKEMSVDGEWSHSMPGRPSTKYRRLLAIAQDFEGDQMVIKAKAFHKAILTDRDSETWASGDDPLMRSVTFGADVDGGVGSPVTEFLLGPGALAYAEARGITVATA